MDISGITSAIFEMKPWKALSSRFHDLMKTGSSVSSATSSSTENVLSTVNDASGVGTIIDISG